MVTLTTCSRASCVEIERTLSERVLAQAEQIATLKSDLVAAREEIARAPVCVGYVKKSDAKYMPQINQEMVLIVKGLSLLCPENGYQPIYIDKPKCNAAHKGEEG